VEISNLSKVVGLVAATLGGLGSYVALGGPLPATNRYVAQVEEFSKGTREIVLLDKLFLRQEQLEVAEFELDNDPSNEVLRKLVNNLRRQIAEIENQLEHLGGEGA
jgi:hypothetical protein